ncbi:hypothetical protein [Sphingomonas soli]|uniref:hypothetical protein n=1 Tax=Sphingomonas soli TaxID=266127 RepID=UPI000A530884|nr:hypothetical protein [Sphingomonas soli]
MLLTMFALIAAQDVPGTLMQPRQESDGKQSWSILADPCAGRPADEITVCGQSARAEPRLPLPGERGPPDRALPSNPDISGTGALAATSAPCATLSKGCTTGVDIFGGATFLVRALGKVIDKDSCCEEPGEATNIGLLVRDTVSAAKKIGRKKPDKSRRVPIPLDDPAPGDGAAPVSGP